MKRLLIIGASILQLPAIKKAKELGHYVAVADFNPNAVGIPYADEFYNASTIDIEAICKVAEEFKPDGIMTLATDMPMRSIAAATSLLGLPGISMDTVHFVAEIKCRSEIIDIIRSDINNMSIIIFALMCNSLDIGYINDYHFIIAVFEKHLNGSIVINTSVKKSFVIRTYFADSGYL